MDERDGIFLRRLNGSLTNSLKIDHVLTINCAHKMILDCVEKFAIWVTEDSIRFCIDGDGHDIKFVEVKRIENKEVDESDRKKHLVNSETRIRKKHEARAESLSRETRN